MPNIDFHSRTPRVRRRLPATLLLLAALLTAGCYSYAPAPLSTVRPGMDIRARLSDEAVARLRSTLSADDAFIYGTVTSSAADGLVLMVPVHLQQQDLAVSTVNRRISLPRSEIVSVDRRVFDRFRTGVLMGIGVVALGVAVVVNR